MEFSRQEYWSGLPFPSPEELPNPGINPGLLHCRQILYRLSYREVCIVKVKVAQSYLTLCDPIGGSPPGSAIPGILQARTLEWVAVSVSDA